VDDNVAQVGNPGKSVGENNHEAFVRENCVRQQQEGTGQADPPEGQRHDDALLFFSRVPLNEKARRKNDVAGPAHDFPPAGVVNPLKLLMQPIHHGEN